MKYLNRISKLKSSLEKLLESLKPISTKFYSMPIQLNAKNSLQKIVSMNGTPQKGINNNPIIPNLKKKNPIRKMLLC